MRDSFFQVICQVGIFMICAQTVIYFRPKEVYEKYLKLLVSVMVLIQIFLPLGGLLLGAGGGDAAQVLEQFKREMEQAVKEAEESAAAADALLEQMTLEEVRSRMEEQGAREAGSAKEGRDDLGVGGLEESVAGEEEEPEAGGQEESDLGGDSIKIEAVEPVRIGPSSPE